jgi:IS30 family transposase
VRFNREEKMMSKLIPGNQKHLTLSDRIEIEKCLKENLAFKEIAKMLCKDPTTISKEIKLHRQFRERGYKTGNTCKHSRTCKVRNLCKNGSKCDRACSACRMRKCNRLCPDYAKDDCKALMRAPYVCNGCRRVANCRLDRYYYRAEYAYKAYTALRREARLGVNATEDEIAVMNEVVTAGLMKGQSVAHIAATNSEVIRCTEKTIYNYIAGGYFTADNFSLPRKLHFKPRKSDKLKEEQRLKILEGRRYTDFIAYMAENDVHVTEMDTVHGGEGTNKVLLTMHHSSSCLLLAFLMDACTQSEVVDVFDEIERKMTPEVFAKTFPVFLTDRGSEFLCAELLERSIDGGMRTKVFFCDPNAPFQKGRLEHSHSLIRRFFPKLSAYNNGKLNTFDCMSQKKITLMVNHINSHARDSLGGSTPMFLANAILNEKVIEALGLELIQPDKVTLKPALLK